MIKKIILACIPLPFYATALNTVIDTISGFNGPTGIAIVDSLGSAYVTNFDAGAGTSVSVVDITSNTLIAAPGLNSGFSGPVNLAIRPVGPHTAYVCDQGSNSVLVINTGSNTIVSAPALVGAFDTPVGIAFTPDGNFAYVCNAASTNVSIIATASNTLVFNGATFDGPYGIAITPNGQFAYVTNYGGGGGTSVSVLDIAMGTLVSTPGLDSGFDGPQGIAITPNGQYAYVCDFNSNSVRVIDIASNTILSTPALTGIVFGPGTVAITPDGTLAYVASNAADVVVIDIATNTVVPAPGLQGVFDQPSVIAITSDGNYAYVANSGADFVSVISLDASVLPPTNVQGKPLRNRFLMQADLVNYISWHASATDTVASYAIYRDAALTDLVATVPAAGTLKYFDHNRACTIPSFYYIVAVDQSGNVSPAVGVVVVQSC